ncbi:MAG TPA: hypothetical protein V6D07_00030, partial [Trichocoleus sp.]
MTLAIGTALQGGNYVIDAFCYEDTLGPTYLATHISSGQVLQVKVLGTRPQQIPDPAMRSQLHGYLQAVSALKHPQIVQNLESFEEGGICYLVMNSQLGQPLSRIVTAQSPLPPIESIAILRQIHEVLEALRPLGWAGLTLTPDQIWQGADAVPVLTGFDLPLTPANSPKDEAQLIRQLAQLLYFLLTGTWVKASVAPTANLCHCCPTLTPTLETAIRKGLGAPDASDSLDLTTWMALLPETLNVSPVAPVHVEPSAQPKPVPVFTPPPTIAPQSVQTHSPELLPLPEPLKSKGFRLQHGLVLTGLVATLTGLGGGLMLRLHTPISPSGTSRLNPEQSFPPLPDWQGDDPIAEFETPYVPDAPAARNRPEEPRHTPSAPEPIETPFRSAPTRYAPPSSDGEAAPASTRRNRDAEVSPEYSSPDAPEPPIWIEPSQPDPNVVSPAPVETAPAAAPAPEPAPAPLPPPQPISAPP